jgi:hypothetical protein
MVVWFLTFLSPEISTQPLSGSVELHDAALPKRGDAGLALKKLRQDSSLIRASINDDPDIFSIFAIEFKLILKQDGPASPSPPPQCDTTSHCGCNRLA